MKIPERSCERLNAAPKNLYLLVGNFTGSCCIGTEDSPYIVQDGSFDQILVIEHLQSSRVDEIALAVVESWILLPDAVSLNGEAILLVGCNWFSMFEGVRPFLPLHCRGYHAFSSIINKAGKSD